MLDQLMWKDFRNLRGVLMLGLFFLVGPYGLYWINDRDPNTLATAVMLSLVASQMTAAVLGATIIGLERQTHGMDFLLGQPIPKSKILLSKALICLIVAVIIWGLSMFVIEVFVLAEAHTVLSNAVRGTAAIGFVLFAVAWLFSVLFRGFAVPIGAALSVTTFLFFASLKLGAVHDWDSESYTQNLATIFYPACIVTALCSFAAGWVAFLRKLEP